VTKLASSLTTYLGKKLTAPVKLGIAAVILAWAILMAVLTTLPWLEVLCLGVLAGGVLAPGIVARGNHERADRLRLFLVWLSTILAPVCLLLPSGREFTVLDTYYALIAWLIAAAIGLTGSTMSFARTRTHCKLLAVIWGLYGVLIWLAFAYLQCLPDTFYAGLLLALAWLVVCKLLFRLPTWGVLATNTLMLLLLLLPVLEWLTRSPPRVDPHPDKADKSYLYAQAKGNPHAFAFWWGKYLRQYDRLMRDLFYRDPTHALPYLIRTNAHSRFFESQIYINSLGFRGPEFPPQKGRTYQIVALGESNTFGFTLNPEHKPWPEILEDLIRQRLKPSRPVQVINAGLPHHSLKNNLYRLRTRILALKPDMIISYHGWNTFKSLFPSLPPNYVKTLPVYKRRPLRILADSEYRIELLLLKWRFSAKPVFKPPPLSELLESSCGKDYQKLISLARTNHIRLVLANYSMAVNRDSDRSVIEFYRETNPSIYPTIAVNTMHSMLLKELARQHPEVCLVDTHPHLDGEHWKFIDTVHFAPEGDQQMAETFFAAIRGLLEKDLASAEPGPAGESSHNP